MAKWRWIAALAALAALAAGGWLIYERSPSRALPYADSFRTGSSEEWTAYGGTWRPAQGAMRNESDERGAKLMTGSPRWRDYTVTTDVELLGQQGDAGVILRGSNEEQGVDSYDGYYAGLRSNDGSLIIGLAQYGWVQLGGTPFPGGVRPFRWYRLRATVRGCRVSAVAVDSATGQTASLSVDDAATCFQRGRVGIRSHSSGGAWKNFSVAREDGVEFSPTPGKPAPGSIAAIPYAIDEPVWNGSNTESVQPSEGTASRFVPAETIASLKLDRRKGRTTVLRGTVVLTAPRLYV